MAALLLEFKPFCTRLRPINMELAPTAPAETPSTPRETKLVVRARDGDARAFEKLYRLYASRTYATCLRLSGDPAKAEELTQEAFIKAWRSLAGFRGDSRFGTWLHRIAVNGALAEFRRAAKATEPLSELKEASTQTPAAMLDLEAAIAQLPNGAREVFVLHDVEGYQHGEIAEMTGVATGTSKAQLHRARKLLREKLQT